MSNILSENVANQIKSRILSGHYAIGEKIPNEKQIADYLKVSRNTVREAIKILVSKNILEIRRGNGTYVHQNPGFSDDPFGVDFLDKENLMEYLIETRKILEPEIAALAAERASEKEISELLNIVNRLQQQVDSFNYLEVNNETIEAVLTLDMEFHHALARLCHNPILERLAPIIHNHLFEFYSMEKVRGFQKNFIGNRNHFEIYTAIRDKDPIKARKLSFDHINNNPWLKSLNLP